MSHRDFIGRELVVGDFVAAIRPGYREIVLGQVDKLTPKMVRVRFDQKDIYEETQVYYSKDLVKLEGPHLTAKLLKGE